MFSLYDNIFCKKNIEERRALQVHPFNIKGKTSFFTFSATKKHAFLTLETALVLPVFICAICAFFWFFVVFRVQIRFQETLRNISSELSEYAFLYDRVRNFSNDETERIKLEDAGIERWLIGGVTELYIENEIKKQIGKESRIWDFIYGGRTGIEIKDFLKIPDKDGMIDLILVYKMKNPFLPGTIGEVEYIQRSRVRAWTGFDYAFDGEDVYEEAVVYITEYGTVYHVKDDCTYLKLSISSVPYLISPLIYNERKYTECLICANYPHSGIENVYVTNTGDRFHWNISCSGLKRTVYKVPIEKAAGYAPCSRCGKDLAE